MPSTEWKEAVADDEETRFAGYAEALKEIQAKSAENGKPARALHAKGHNGLRAELEILPDLPEHARQGIFAAPGKYEAFVRYSNGAARRQSDRAGDVRGIAIKVLGVKGPKIIPGLESATTQDFLAIQSSATPFRTPDEFVAFVRAMQSPLSLVFRLLGAIGPVRAFQILGKVARSAGAPVGSLAGIPFYSALPIRVGPYAARFAFEPLQATDAAAPEDRARDYLGDDLSARVAKGPIAYDMKLQFFEDETKTPIEDASVDWTSPYVKVARLTIPKQDTTSAEGRELAAKVEAMSFDPWHALAEHKPLGAMMRARKHAYYASIKGRDASAEPS